MEFERVLSNALEHRLERQRDRLDLAAFAFDRDQLGVLDVGGDLGGSLACETRVARAPGFIEHAREQAEHHSTVGRRHLGTPYHIGEDPRVGLGGA